MKLYCASVFCALAVAGAQCVAAPATAPVPQAPEAHVAGDLLSKAQKRELLAKLASDQWTVREAASQQLVGMGEAARPLIAELLAGARDAEARERLKLALERIDQERISGASVITLHLKAATPREIFAELSRQCFAELRPYPDNLWEQQKWPSVNVDIDRKPFWEAMDQLSAQTGVYFQSAGEGQRLMRAGPAVRSGRTLVCGAFQVVATAVNHSQSVSLGDGSRQSHFSVMLWLAAEPKVQVLSAGPNSDLEEAIDDRQNSLMPDGSSGSASPSGGMGEWSWPVTLKFPEHPGTRIARLRGAASFLVQTSSQKINLRNLPSIRQKPQASQGLTILVQEIRQNGSTYELSLSVRHDGADARWGSIEQTLYQRLKISDSAGRVYQYSGMSSRGTENGVDLTLTLAPPDELPGGRIGAPFELIWEIPTATKVVRVPFEFKDLPMP